HRSDLVPLMISDWAWLPDLFGKELGISATLPPEDALQQLGIRHQELAHSLTNWAGTYQNVVHHLIRYKQRELQWNQSLPKP
ncbi:MAG TPA: hypothetical protein VEA58_10300, partial [Anaerovoracaceae bacterium]|nr:hypothetical protein [Anaerovoracaceae bacterium]